MIINEFRFSKDLVKEYVLAYWMKPAIIYGCITLAFFSYYLYLYLGGYKTALWVMLMVLLIPIMSVIRIRRDIKVFTERNMIRHGKEDPECRVEIGEDILFSVEDVSVHITPDNIKKCIQTKNLVVFYLKGGMAVMMRKDSFVQGSAQECMEWYKKIK